MNETRGSHLLANLRDLHNRWGWILAFGIIVLALGIAAIVRSSTATITIVRMFGWLLLIGGVVHLVHAFQTRNWGGFFHALLTGVLYLVTGFVLAANPLASALALTLVMALFLITIGIFRIVAALSSRFPSSSWVLLNGIVSVILGVLIWRQWPVSGLWVIGLFVGIEMIFSGWSLIALSMVAKNLPTAGGESMRRAA